MSAEQHSLKQSPITARWILNFTLKTFWSDGLLQNIELECAGFQ